MSWRLSGLSVRTNLGRLPSEFPRRWIIYALAVFGNNTAPSVGDNSSTWRRHLVDSQEDLNALLDHGGRRENKPEPGEHVLSERGLPIVFPGGQARQQSGRHRRKGCGMRLDFADGYGAVCQLLWPWSLARHWRGRDGRLEFAASALDRL